MFFYKIKKLMKQEYHDMKKQNYVTEGSAGIVGLESSENNKKK
jgi:hypothetical protein